MKNVLVSLHVVGVFILFALPSPCPGAEKSDQWIFSAGYVHYARFSDIRSVYKKNAAASGDSRDVAQWSFGLTVQAHYRITDSLRVGGGVGPILTLLRDADHIQAPASVSMIAYLLPTRTHSPFIRLGGSYHIAAGDDLRRSRPGMLAGMGMAFFISNRLHLTAEVAYDGAWVSINRPAGSTPAKIRAGAPVFSISAVF